MPHSALALWRLVEETAVWVRHVVGAVDDQRSTALPTGTESLGRNARTRCRDIPHCGQCHCLDLSHGNCQSHRSWYHGRLLLLVTMVTTEQHQPASTTVLPFPFQLLSGGHLAQRLHVPVSVRARWRLQTQAGQASWSSSFSRQRRIRRRESDTEQRRHQTICSRRWLIHLYMHRHHLNRPHNWDKGAITSKIKHAIKHKTSPARLAQLLHNCCSPH